MATVPVSAERSYLVKIGSSLSGLFAGAPWLIAGRNVLLVCTEDSRAVADEVASFMTAEGLSVSTVDVPRGEAAKSVTTMTRLWDACSHANLDRDGLVVAVGGGTVTDVAGFVAATWMRGVDWVAIPTTTAGMVDAAIGGKTGINTDNGKNLVGSFHSPVEVLCATSTLRSLPRAEYASGLVEAVKCGFIADPAIVESCAGAGEDIFNCDSSALIDVVQRAIAVKAQVVSRDFTEQAKSVAASREILNYGHTFGHALEATSGYRMRHGDAVAVGMVFAAELSDVLGKAARGLATGHRQALVQLGVPITHHCDNFDELLTLMARDKKARSGVLRFVLLRDLGEVFMADAVDIGALKQAFERTREAAS